MFSVYNCNILICTTTSLPAKWINIFMKKWPAERCACLKTFSSTQALCIVLVVCVCTCNCECVSLFVCFFGCQPLSQPNSYYIFFFHKLNKSQQKVTGLPQTKGISNSTGTLFWLTVCVHVHMHLCMHISLGLCTSTHLQAYISVFTLYCNLQSKGYCPIHNQ